MIIDFLTALGRDIAQFFTYTDAATNFFSSTLLLVVGIVLVCVIRNFIFWR